MRSCSLVLLALAACGRPAGTSPPAPAPTATVAAPVPAPAPAPPPSKADADAAYAAQDWARCAALYAALDDPYDAACCHARAGALDAAFTAFDQAVAGGFRDLDHVRADPDLETLRADPRWPAALARLEAARDAWRARLDGELLALYEADQADRRPGPDGIDWSQVAPRDQQRRARVLALIDAGRARVADDWYHAAMVFQHGDTVLDIERARTYAERAVALEPGHRQARWLYAAATDRALMRRDQPQKYGTQYTRQPGGPWVLHPVDPATTDEERARWNVPPLAEAQRRAAQMNQSTRNAK